MRRGFSGTSGKVIGVVAAAVLLLLARAPIVQAISEAEKSFLSLYFSEDELHVISATRSLQSIARVAENMEVITASDIELMNAHTLGDVLNTVSGVQIDFTGGFGAIAMPRIQGADSDRVTILLNGVPLNNFNSGVAEVGFYPVQDIEKIEIVKGPASSAWGSALGGVINVITRRPGSEPFQGSASLSYGTKNSADYRATISGRTGRLGYYLSGSGLRTDGLTEGFDNDATYLGARLEYALAERTDLAFNLFYGDASRGDGTYPPDDLLYGNHTKHLVSSLSLASAVGKESRLALSLWTTRFDDVFFLRQISDGAELFEGTDDEHRTGASVNYAWSHGVQDLVLGADYSAGTMKTSDIPGEKLEQTQWAVYVNDTLSLGPWTIAPGIRYDDNSTSDNFWSPSLGTTYALSKNTLLRATVARGFNAPTLVSSSGTSEINMFQGNPALTVEKVWSYQGGFEANVLDGVWLKVSAFRHDLEDAIVHEMLADPPDWWTVVNQGRQRRQGVEIAARTKPIHHLTLAAAAFFLETEDLDTHEKLLDFPRRIFDLSLKYDDERSFRALLKGRYNYTVPTEGLNADFGGFIFDLNLVKKFAVTPRSSLETFLTVNNLFNGAQYWADIFKNPGRWVEGGVRVSF